MAKEWTTARGGARRRSTGPAALVAALVASLAVLAGAVPASAGPPAPAVPVTPAPVNGASQVFGTNAAGDTFYNAGANYETGSAGGGGRIRHADGTVVTLASPLSANGRVGPDGRLRMPVDGALWAVAPDGTRTEYPVTAPDAAAPRIDHVDVGPDGRIWFLDRQRNTVGSVATDGSGLASWQVSGSGGLWRFAPGVDGRMWIVRTTGGLQAITTTGTVTTYPTLGSFVTGLRATSGSLYAMVKGSLLRIAPDGTRTTAWSSPDAGLIDVGASDGWAWFASDSEVLAVSPSGRVAPFGMPVSYVYPTMGTGLSIAPDAAGGFVGTVDGALVRLPAAVNETLTATGTVVSKGGAFVLRVTATGRTPGGAALSGPVDVVLWGSQLLGDSLGYFSEVRQTTVGRVNLVNGRATVEIPITAALVRTARPGGALHTFCCAVAVRRPATATGPGLSSWTSGVTNTLVHSYYGSVVASPTMLWLDAMSSRALGTPMDTAGQVYWAGKLASGAATRVAVTRTVVGSLSWRRHRVAVAYEAWLGRAPTTAERDAGVKRLETGTTSALDLALAVTPAARDANGKSTTNRAAHLAAALGLSPGFATGFRGALDAGTPWSTVVRNAYGSASARNARIDAMGPRSSYTPSRSTLGAQLLSTGDERGPLVSVLATLPNLTDAY